MRRPWFAPLVLSAVVALLAIGAYLLVNGTYIPVLDPSGEVAGHQRNIIVLTIILSMVVIVPVFSMVTIFAWKYRAGNKNKNYTPEWDENNLLEAIWWGIPILIIIGLSLLTYFTSHSLDPYRAIESDKETVKVQVVALQWKWLFIYPDLGVATVNDLTIPVDRPVHFTLSADAPMSAFWIPALGSQIYSMNAMSSQLNLIANEVGVYKGYNTNINGEGYSKMVFDTNVVSEDRFEEWYNQHADSGHSLDKQHLAELTEPGLISAPMYMSLADDNLYNSVVMKYMGHGSSSDSHAGPEHGAPEPFDEALDAENRSDDLTGDVDNDHQHNEKGVH